MTTGSQQNHGLTRAILFGIMSFIVCAVCVHAAEPTSQADTDSRKGKSTPAPASVEPSSSEASSITPSPKEAAPTKKETPAPSVSLASTKATTATTSKTTPAEPLAPVPPVMSRELAEDLINACTSYLVGVCNEDGSFIYRTSLDPSKTPKPAYNELRHAGTIYALTCSYRRKPDEAVKAAILRSTAYFRTTFVKPLINRPGTLAVMTGEGADNIPCAKLGGAGLGLVALVSVEQLFPETIPMDDLRGLGKFILFMMQPDGKFFSKHYPTHGTMSVWGSLYYPGEAILGMVLLSQMDKDTIWSESAVRGLEYLAASRINRNKVEADHWALLATESLFRHAKKSLSEETQQRLALHAQQIAHSIVAEKFIAQRQGASLGAYDVGGRTCPVSTRMEGLQAFLAMKTCQDAAFVHAVEETVSHGMTFLRVLVRRESPMRGAVPRAYRRLAPTPENKSHNIRMNEVRIDYVQHALCALIQYDHALEEASASHAVTPTK